jgi:protein SCO1/2
MPGTSGDLHESGAAPGGGGTFPGDRAGEALSRFFTGAAFPVFALGVLLLYELVLVGLMIAPRSDAGLGAFAEDFRVWCFGSDAATGRANWGYAIGMISPPVFVIATVAWLWWAPLAALRRSPARAVRPALAALLLVVAGAGATVLYAPRPARGELPFPADALRTEHRPPPLRLTDQTRAMVDLAELRGKVVLLTGIYASCGFTCPMIMAEAKRVAAGLTPAECRDLRVIAVTLDPGHDTPEVLNRLAEAQGLAPPLWHFVTGEPREVERTLDLMGVSRSRDPATGVIDHANLFMLVDRRGRVAYRFTLGPRQEGWLAAALRVLLHEPPDAG